MANAASDAEYIAEIRRRLNARLSGREKLLIGGTAIILLWFAWWYNANIANLTGILEFIRREFEEHFFDVLFGFNIAVLLSGVASARAIRRQRKTEELLVKYYDATQNHSAAAG